MKERKFQRKIADELRTMDCVVLVVSTLPGIPVGFPDLLILAPNGKWLTLEVKASATSKFQPLQKATIAKLHGMAYSKVVHPDNWDSIRREVSGIIKG